jgi:serine/threonine protein kinase
MTNRACSTCGSEIRPGSPAGQCARCLLEMARGGLEPESPDLLSPTDADFLSRSQVRRFGDYELIEEIARGGMGIVYRARQISLQRPVAVKMILTGHFAAPELVARFQLEARAAAALDHPNIVPIYEVGEHETQHYFAMKYVEGGSLADRMADFRLGAGDSRATARERARRIAALLIKVADALDHAHVHGVMHRDVKPTNILLDRQDEPMLTDFGLAKFSDRGSDLTLSHALLGTPAYMAPEQAAGRAKSLTTAADVYGLGAVLYELLTGRPPFTGDTPLVVARKVIEEEPQWPLALNPGAPRDLGIICLKCLEKEPTRRYPSAAAVG